MPDVLDGAEQPLVHVAHAERHRSAPARARYPRVNSPALTGFMFGSMPVMPGRLKYSSKPGSTWFELWRKSTNSMNRPGQPDGAFTALDAAEVGRVERPVVVDPVVAAERAARQFQLRDVVERAVAAERLPLAVALDVVGEAEARRDLVLEVELDVERVRETAVWSLYEGTNSFSARTPRLSVRRELTSQESWNHNE